MRSNRLGSNMEDMTPEEYQAVMGLVGLDDQAGDLTQQLILNLRKQQNMPQLQGTQAGRTFVANNPMEHIANMLNSQRFNREERDIQSELRALRKQRQEGVGAYGRALLRRPPIQDIGVNEDNVPMPNGYGWNQ